MKNNMNNNFNSIIKRNGYGSNFNILYLNDDKTLILKKTINNYGLKKLKYEINFYNFILNNKINLQIPTIHNYNDDIIMMDYINENKLNIDYFDLILENLKNLHCFNNKTIDKNYYKQLLFEETIIKIKERYKIIQHLLEKNILFVNNIKLLNYNDIICKLTDFFNLYVNELDKYILEPIHGDPQYNNIIFNNKEIFFIDPKGIFGTSEIYGIKEYDIAKLYFSLSGYYNFDNMIIEDVIIDNNNLNINYINTPNFNIHEKNNYYKNIDVKLVKYLFISIWLSNAHMFINQPNKVIYSFYTGLYFASSLL